MTIRAHSTEDSKHELEFEMFSNSGVIRRHKFHYADCEIMNADFDDEAASYLKSEPKIFTQLLVRTFFISILYAGMSFSIALITSYYTILSYPPFSSPASFPSES